jgi:hypothetical protein
MRKLPALWIALLSLSAAEHRGTVTFGGLPVPGAAVTATRGTARLTTVTGEDGAYAFPDLDGGPWQVRVDMQLFLPQTREITPGAAPVVADPNNSAASGGYDAYFGTYAIDGATGTVTHHLVGALTPADVGRTLTRRFALEGASLVIWFEARRTDGTPVIRRLRWRRAG